MIKFLPLVLVLATAVHDEVASYRTNGNQGSEETIQKNRNELQKIIKFLNGHGRVADNYERVKKQDEDNLARLHRNGKLKKPRVGEFTDPGVRIHFIRNPQVLDQFRKYLRDTSSSSSDDSLSDDDRRRGNDVARRNALFRVQGLWDLENQVIHKRNDAKNANEEENRPNFPPSIEDQVTPFKPHIVVSDENKKSGEVKTAKRIQFVDLEPLTKRFKVKSKNDQSKKKTTRERSRNKNNDLSNNHENSDDEYRKSKLKDNAWDEEETADRRSDEDAKTTKSIWVEEKKSLKKSLKESRKQKDTWGNSESDWVKTKNADKFDESDSPKKSKKWVETRTKKKRDDWDEPKKNVENDWDSDRPLKKKKVSWDSPKKKEVDNDWAKVGKEWGKSKKDFDSGRGSKKKKSQDYYEKPSYARVPEYHKARGRELGAFQGRTPIPFVGKRGVYDEK